MLKNCMDSFSLRNKVIIITGAAGFLGRMHCRAVIEAGAVAVLIDVNSDKLMDAKVELQNQYPKACIESFNCSITEKGELCKIRDFLERKFHRIDGLVNNACNNPTMKSTETGQGRFESLTYAQWLGDSEVGLYGSICCSQVFGSYMSNHGGGVIVNIASDLGIIAPNQNLYRVEGESEENQPKKPVTYSTVKWGLIGLTKYLSTYWADKNVRANALAFGGVFNHQNEEFLQRVIELIPMRRMAEKDEYMGSLVFMLSSASSYMNGAVLSIDGGRTAW